MGLELKVLVLEAHRARGEGEGVRAIWVGCSVKVEWERESSVERGPMAGH